MKRWKCLLFILACLSQIGCAALLTEQVYVLIDRPVSEKATFNGEIYSLPESGDSENYAARFWKDPEH